jgi:hypothetical protein
MKLNSALASFLALAAAAMSPSAVIAADPQCVPATANLLVNGSFEATKMTPDRTWDEFSQDKVPGWKSLNGQGIELWSTGMFPAAVDGINLLEIDRNINKVDYLYQDIQTVAGQKYEVSFYIRARQANMVGTEDETAVFIWNKQETSYKAPSANVWTKITTFVEGTGGLDHFGIRESTAAGANTSYGPLLDDFRLIGLSCTAAPTTAPTVAPTMAPTAPRIIVTPRTIDGKPLSDDSNNKCFATGEENLLVNGSFEATKVTSAQYWDEFSQDKVPGWKSMHGQGIELWTTGMKPDAVDGVNLLEIDRDINKVDYLYQDIQTIPGQKYEVSFYIRARQAKMAGTEDETAVFIWNEQETSYTAPSADVWTQIITIVEGTGGLDHFGIRESTEAGANTSYGPLLDDFRLIAASCEGDDHGDDFDFPVDDPVVDPLPPTEVPVETLPPTEAPVKAPTAAPTKAPTAAPTKAPTAAPTKAPTAAPTKAPTAAPTKAPTAAPTKAPTKAPITDGTTRSGDKPQTGGGGGDPHFKTWTGHKYDYHGECDLVLVHSPTFAGGRGLRVHIRTTRIKYYSYIERIAVQIGSDVMEFANDLEQWTLNGTAAPREGQPHLGGYKVQTFQKAHALSIRLNDKTLSKIDLFRRRNGMPYVVVDGGHDQQMFEGSLGLIGDWETGRMLARDGQTELTDATAFALEWQVRDTEPMLFATARFPQFPQVCTPPQKRLGGRLGDSHMLKKAEHVCQAWKEDKEDCIFDVMATRDTRNAEEAPVHHTATHNVLHHDDNDAAAVVVVLADA